jgi:hypothetical protein
VAEPQLINLPALFRYAVAGMNLKTAVKVYSAPNFKNQLVVSFNFRVTRIVFQPLPVAFLPG